MSEPVDPKVREELFELYSELHLACGRAAAALRLASNWDAPEQELLDRFRLEEARAARIWERIVELRSEHPINS
jgi:nicotinamide mononucleotide adenylyltransferase